MANVRWWVGSLLLSSGLAAAGCGSERSSNGSPAGGASGSASSGGALSAGGLGAGGMAGSAGTSPSGGGGAGGSGGAPHVPLHLGVDPPKTGTFTDARDMTQYGWVEIDGVRWMSENLRFVLGDQDLQSCYFDLDKGAEDCTRAGYFYGWSAAMNEPRIANQLTLNVADGTYQGICPDGWHLPTRAEWMALFDYVDGLANIPKPMDVFGYDYRGSTEPLLSTSEWRSGFGTNELGLNIKPYEEADIGNLTSFWGSDEAGRQAAEVIKISSVDAVLRPDLKEYRQAVRCIEGMATQAQPRVQGPMLTHTTGSFTDPRDHSVYPTAQIGTQLWLAQDLYFEPATGDSLCYANQAEHCRIFGRLYGYDTAQTVCPTGWHIPSVDEWHQLATYVDDQAGKAGVSMKTPGYYSWLIGAQLVAPWEAWEGNPKDAPPFGFNALPGGFALGDDQSGSLEEEGQYWSAKGATDDQVAVTINTSYLSTGAVTKGVEAYVRCLHD